MRRLPLLAALLCAPAVPWSQAQIDRRVGTYRAQEEVLFAILVWLFWHDLKPRP